MALTCGHCIRAQESSSRHGHISPADCSFVELRLVEVHLVKLCVPMEGVPSILINSDFSQFPTSARRRGKDGKFDTNTLTTARP